MAGEGVGGGSGEGGEAAGRTGAGLARGYIHIHVICNRQSHRFSHLIHILYCIIEEVEFHYFDLLSFKAHLVNTKRKKSSPAIRNVQYSQ